ncbi:MAG TPA: BadF/BadG/BcrA/BcrD ATPase family protein [Aggregatilineaceae bacterium]|nr:BadF/BadG/BcrA/BcrD ATPase family protein [Aggregatilineaceae bacterium]
MTDYVMGIDGGGSTIRVVIVTPNLQIRGQSEGPTANPSITGREQAAATIQQAMREAIRTAELTAEQITAVGIGVAGAAAHHSAEWLRTVTAAVVPQAQIIPSADFEIALVGAVGKREGVLVLAGTGSLAYGVNADGKTTLVGGWGYLLDDAGSGYWIGRAGLEAIVRASDGRGPSTKLTSALLDALHLQTPLDLIAWLYRSEAPRMRDVAGLTPLVFEVANQGDIVAQRIVARAADELFLAVQTVKQRLVMDENTDIAFAGGLLASSNPLSDALCAALNLPTLPLPRYSPVIGAALLALLSKESKN